MAPWASSNPQPFPPASFTHSATPRASRGGRVQAHPSQCFPNQTATGNFDEIQKRNCSYPCPARARVPSSPPPRHPPSSREGKSKGQSAARQPLVKPPRCPNPRAQQSGGRAGGAALVPSLPCEATECLGSVVCPMGMRRNEGAVRRGEVMRKGARGRRKSAALRLRGLGSSRGLLRTSRAGWGAGCRT